MANIDLGNLTRYDGKIKQYAEDKYLSKNTANWQMTEKAGAVTCYPVPNTELEPIVDFSFKEVPPVSGDKSPSNPSVITSVSDIKVMRHGKNLLKYPYASTEDTFQSGMTATTKTDGSVTINGTNGSSIIFFSVTDGGISAGTPASSVRLDSGSVYAVSLTVVSGTLTNASDIKLVLINHEIGQVVESINAGETAYVAANFSQFRARLEFAASATFNNVTVLPQLELSSIAASLESYANTDYAIQLDNTYYGGSVNLATGLMTVTHNSIIFDGTESIQQSAQYGFYYTTQNKPKIKPQGAFVTSHYPVESSIAVRMVSFTTGQNTTFGWSDNASLAWSTVSDLQMWLTQQYTNGTPLTVVYELANPFTVQLNPVQIKSLTALDKNTPRLNTLYTDADSIQVGYQKHPARTAYELENAILALGGGE